MEKGVIEVVNHRLPAAEGETLGGGRKEWKQVGINPDEVVVSFAKQLPCPPHIVPGDPPFGIGIASRQPLDIFVGQKRMPLDFDSCRTEVRNILQQPLARARRLGAIAGESQHAHQR